MVLGGRLHLGGSLGAGNQVNQLATVGSVQFAT
jgi:hypothetical protein